MSNTMPTARHPTYYIPSGDIVFLVGARLFRVHRYFFVRDSVKFRNMLPVDVEAVPTRASDAHAILLVDITAEEFESLLWIFYNDEYDQYEAPVEKWVAILRLAHMWQFPKIKLLATRKLCELDIDPVDKAVMARDYEVDPTFGWQEQAYEAIAEREEPISESEGEKLGVRMVVALANLRETRREGRHEKERRTWRQNEDASYDLVSSPTEDLVQLPNPPSDCLLQRPEKSPSLCFVPFSEAVDEPSAPPAENHEIWEVLDNHSVDQQAATPTDPTLEDADIQHSVSMAHPEDEITDAVEIYGKKGSKKGVVSTKGKWKKGKK